MNVRSSGPRRAHCRQDGKILDSSLSYPIFCSQFPFQAVPSRNLGWVDVDGLAGHTKHALYFQEVLEEISVLISPEYVLSYSIYSLARLSWHGTCENELWMVDLGFLLPFPFKVSCQKLRLMNFGWQDFGFLLFSSHFPLDGRSWISAFPIPLSLRGFLSRSVRT